MAAKHRSFMTACIIVTPLFFGVSPLADQIAGMEVSINPRATYLRTNLDSSALGATPINLAMLNILAGDFLRLEQLGDFDCGAPCVDDRTAMIGMFSGSTTLLSADQLHRVPSITAHSSTKSLRMDWRSDMGNEIRACGERADRTHFRTFARERFFVNR
jgi:hypothetical protein